MATESGALAANRDIESISEYTGKGGVIKYAYKTDRVDYIGWKCPTKGQIKGNEGGDFIGVSVRYADNQCVLYEDITPKQKSITITIVNNVNASIDCEIMLYKTRTGNDEGTPPDETYNCVYDSPTQETYSMLISIDDLGKRLGIKFKNNKGASRKLSVKLINNDLGATETLYYNQSGQVLSADKITMSLNTSIMYYTEIGIFESLKKTSGSFMTPGIYFYID